MRYILTAIASFITLNTLMGQETLQGKVSYITSQHVYVRFGSTGGLEDGDTLYIKRSAGELPVLVILNHSSTSCVCEPLGDPGLKLSDVILGRPKARTSAMEPQGVEAISLTPPADEETAQEVPAEGGKGGGPGRKQEIGGRLSVASYTFLKNSQSEGSQRMRYAFSMDAGNIGGSGLTLESYLTFSHTLNQWEEIQENIFHGLKIYKLSASYAFRHSMVITAGRRINPRLSSVGAIDGLQFEKGFGSLKAGIIAGYRPDYQDYSINTDLFQYGAYLAHDLRGANGQMQNTLAYVEQMNGGATDRRFLYFQHTNSLVKNLWFFGSVETDLYQRVDGTSKTVLNLYNTYLMARYRVLRPLTLSVSYSARNNLIYYETYKDFLDRLLEDKMLQGWRFRVNYHPLPHLYLGAHAAYRYRKDDPLPTKNVHAYATYSQIPAIGASVTATVTWLQSSYLEGMIYGLGIDRDFLHGKLHAAMKYHFVDQSYFSAEQVVAQHVGEASLAWTVYRKLALFAHYEGTFEEALEYHRIYAGLTQRF
jgi:hypothetical protein